MNEVDDLILGPFRDIVQKAELAVDNAGDDHADMASAASTLLKAGRRAVSHIEPLCSRYLDDYGSAFIAAVKDNAIISQHRATLNEILYDFEEFIEPDDFDAAEFTRLKDASRKAALAITEALKCIKIDTPPASDAASSTRGSIVVGLGSGGQLPTPPLSHAHLPSSPASSYLNPNRGSSSTSGGPVMDVRDATAQLREMYPNAPSTDGSSIYTTDTGGGRRESMAPPPRPPMANPWDWNQRAPGVTPDDDAQSPGADRAESPVLPFASPSTPRMTAAQPPTLPGGERRVSAASTSSAASDYHYHHAMAMRPRHNTGLSNFSIPEDDVTQQQPSTPPASALPPIPTHKRAPTFRDSGIGSPISPTTPEVPVPDGHKPSYLPGFIQAGSTGDSEDAAVVPDSAQAPEVVPKDRLPQDDGLIPVETEPSALVHDMTEKEKEDAKILPDSSVTLAGGFCDGAKDVIRGGIGVKRVKKPAIVTAVQVARCTGCLYELDFARIEADVNRHDKGNHTIHGVGYRMRFLQKSHIAAKRVEDVQYACLFCAELGHTLHKSDATVFFSPGALLEHVARHPRPLPEVAGLTVIDGDHDVPDVHRNDYDLHLRYPPREHPVLDGSRLDVASGPGGMPTGIAKETARRMYGQRLLPNRVPALQVAAGARITGLRWPEEHRGEWCFGWHEGAFASIPFDIMRLEPPPPEEIRYDSRSLVTAKARWRFVVKDKEFGDWLKFDKGDTITNLAWVDRGHWCWTGTNASKKKSGLFPQTFLDINTIQQPSVGSSARTLSLKEEQARSTSSSSLMSRFSMRKGK